MKIIYGVIAILLGLSLTACGADAAGQVDPATGKTVSPVSTNSPATVQLLPATIDSNDAYPYTNYVAGEIHLRLSDGRVVLCVFNRNDGTIADCDWDHPLVQGQR